MNNNRCLLCIDDEAQILNSLSRSLRKEPYKLITTTDPQNALELLNQNSVQVIISDYRMEQKTGLELLKEIKRTHPHIIRVILSGYADEALIEGALKNGDVHAYLLKPFDTEKLKESILKFFTHYEESLK